MCQKLPTSMRCARAALRCRHSLSQSAQGRRQFSQSSLRQALSQVILFGYDSFVIVPSMMPRPTLTSLFNLTYRKIPVLAMPSRRASSPPATPRTVSVYCDTSLILEALETAFPAPQHASLYPGAPMNRTLMRGFASYWTDRPFFRAVCGLMPADVWRSAFGRDRAGLVGHVLDPAKLELKIPRMLSATDMHLSFFEALFSGRGDGWAFGTETPSLADLSIYYQLKWGYDTAMGIGVENLTDGAVVEWGGEKGTWEGMGLAFNERRYPGLWSWFARFETHMQQLGTNETRVEKDDVSGIEKAVEELLTGSDRGSGSLLMDTPAGPLTELDRRNGLVAGARVSVAPDDTGMNDPTFGTLLEIGPEEIAIEPSEIDGKKPSVGSVRVHFPRLGFIARPVR